jgi:tetratricopeptide (TPR) repeat protein
MLLFMQLTTQRPFSRTLQRSVCAMAFIVGSTLALPSLAAADDYAAIKQALTTGQTKDALTLVKAARDKQPKDVQLMFFEGVINAQLGESRAAIGIFERMAKDYPELPEPHNNLGVLYAARGDLEKAKAAFERAIFTNPAYATAHQNVADIYAAMARKNYGQALQVGSDGKAVPPQMTLLGSLTGKTTATGKVTPPVVVLKTPEPEPAPTVVAKVEEPKPAPAAAPTPLPKPDDTTAANTAAVEQAVNAWAKAWAARDVKAYLAAYGTAFKPDNGKSRSAWEAERESRIAPRKRIAVTLSNVRITLDDKGALVRFKQRYESDTFNGTSQKRLRLVSENGRWVITDESVD